MWKHFIFIDIKYLFFKIKQLYKTNTRKTTENPENYKFINILNKQTIIDQKYQSHVNEYQSLHPIN